MDLLHHGHGRLPHALHHDHVLHDRVLYRHHNASDHHEDDMTHIHDYALANHTDLDGCYRTRPQSHVHQSKISQHSHCLTLKMYFLHVFLFPTHHHDHANNLGKYNHWHHALNLLHVKPHLNLNPL